MAQKLDPKELVNFKELLMATIQMDGGERSICEQIGSRYLANRKTINPK